MTRKLMGAGVLCFASWGVPAALAQETWTAAGSLVTVTVQVDGAPAPLYPAPDGSGRYYVEARLGAAYEVRIDNRSGERLGVALGVDGLNAISGERDPLRPGDPGRMYVLDPWEGTSVRGWRTSLSEVHRFTFVDERSSYAVRMGKSNGRLGWIEVAVYREQRPYVWRGPRPAPVRPYEGERDEARERPAAPPATAPPAAEKAPSRDVARSYPGTGWGRAEQDQAVVVDFHPQSVPAERLTLRYEYAAALARLGIAPRTAASRDRLWERERGRDGFARPPR